MVGIRSLTRRVARRLDMSKDARWLSQLERSTRKRVVVNRRDLPGFPSEELQVHTVGSSGITAIREAFRFYVMVRDMAAQHARPLATESRILDFGMGWGRTIRCFLKDVSPDGLYGVDVSQEFLDAATGTNVPGTFSAIQPDGALPHASGFFDLVYAYSVFTHLPEQVQTHWLAEIHRVLKPDGMLVATVEPRRFLERCTSLDPASSKASARDRKVALFLREHPKALGEFDHEGFLYLPTSGPHVPFGNAVSSPEYVRRHWGKWFTILEYLDDEKRFRQAVVSARNRGAGSAT